MVNYRLKDIGLIKDTNITLNDITLICGQNNTGKTYITYTIYGFLFMWNDLIDFNITDDVFEDIYENGYYKLDISSFQEKVPELLQELSVNYTNALSNVFSVDSEWFSESLFEVSINDFKLNKTYKINDTYTSSKKEILQINKEEESLYLEISILSKNSLKPAPRFVIEQGINKALGEIYFKDYFKNPFIITSERTGISLFYKELDINKNVMVEHITKNKGKDINPFEIFEDTISRYAMPIKHNIDFTRELGDGITKKKSFLYTDREINKYFSDILQGSYKVINKEVYFVTKKNKKQIPMYFSSSATKSLIELYFYINTVQTKVIYSLLMSLS